MRIGLVIDRMDPKLGGVEQWTWQFGCWLRTQRHEVHVVARSFSESIGATGMIPHAISCGDRLSFADAAARKLHVLALDIVHDTGVGWCCDLLQPHGGSRDALFEQSLKLEPVWSRGIKRAAAHVLPRYRAFDRLSELQYAPRARHLVLAISRMVANDLRRFHQVPEDRLRLVYNGVDTQRFSPAWRGQFRAETRRSLGVLDRETLLLIVAHNFRLKGVQTLLKSVGALRSQKCPIRLVVAGGKRTAYWRALAWRYGALEATTFLGSVSDPVPLYAAADVYVQPTFYDPCSLVVLEALASGLPVITTRYNGASELLDPGENGFVLHDPSDAVELTAALRPMLDFSLREQMGRAARQLAEQHTLERNCREILAVYEEIARLRRRASAA